MLHLIFFCLISDIVTSSPPSTVVHLNVGPIEGNYEPNKITGKPYFAFQGVPYAEPPLGNLRFQPPQKLKSWNNIRETKTEGPKCFQKTGGTENCLYLNVFSPTLPTDNDKKLIPVMVYIHGGAFVHGSSTSKKYSPQYLMNKNVVLVTFNYRLNIFGFLNARNDLAQGNAGLKDQVAVLNWVQENIEKFNGDPKQVTVFGHSAGGSSVHYLMLSELAKGLFHKAISQSGTTLNDFAFHADPINVINKLGEILPCKTENITEMISCLQNVSTEDLYKAAFHPKIMDRSQPKLNFPIHCPSIENDIPGAFLTENSYSLLLANKISNPVPLMIGYVDEEALLFLEDIKQKKIDVEYYNKYPELLIPASLNIINNSNTLTQVKNEILSHYFNNTPVTDIGTFIKYQSQNIFVRGIRKSIDMMRKNLDLYFYEFTYKSKQENSEYPGVPHGGEIRYIFYNTSSNETNEDKKIREKMTTLWTNFAKSGNPTPKEDLILDNIIWSPVSKLENDKIKYLKIDEILNIIEITQCHSCEFWGNIFKKYGKKPFYLW